MADQYSFDFGDSFTVTDFDIDDIDYDGITITTGDSVDAGGILSVGDLLTTPYINTGYNSESSIVIGNTKLTETKLKKIEALLDIVESSEDLKELLDTQIALNKLK